MNSPPICKEYWKTCVENHTFFRLIAPPVVPSKGIFNIGSRYRYRSDHPPFNSFDSPHSWTGHCLALHIVWPRADFDRSDCEQWGFSRSERMSEIARGLMKQKTTEKREGDWRIGVDLSRIFAFGLFPLDSFGHVKSVLPSRLLSFTICSGRTEFQTMEEVKQRARLDRTFQR